MMVGLCAPMLGANRALYLWNAWIRVEMGRCLMDQSKAGILGRELAIGECREGRAACMLLNTEMLFATRRYDDS